MIVLPIVAVVTVGGGTVVLLQPFAGGGEDGTRAQSPGSSASATPGGINSTGKPGSSPAKEASGKSGGDGKGEDAEKGQGGETAQAGEKVPRGPRASGSPDDKTHSGSGGTGTSSGSGSSRSSRSSGSNGGDSGSGGSPSGSRPPALKSYKAEYTNSCVGACDMPIKVSWSAISGATRYDIRYTNTSSNFTKKNVDTTYSTGSTSYTIKGPYSGDEICGRVRAANKHSASAWAETLCDTVPY
ncbi:hypothetical protein ACIRP2_21885 [Streptomyces sp. NPDC101194]|uniref:hypothetical protein n=1 Tax=Streptomyces sp. NPDC101194 TaxID=3366127 RepID=UPI0037FE73C0